MYAKFVLTNNFPTPCTLTLVLVLFQKRKTCCDRHVPLHSIDNLYAFHFQLAEMGMILKIKIVIFDLSYFDLNEFDLKSF